MALLITGHPRSGTQLLQQLCDRHPAISLTNEFGCFRAMGTPITLYMLGVMGRVWARRGWPIVQQPAGSRCRRLLRSYRLQAHFLYQIYQNHAPLVRAADVERALQTLFPEARVVGDKLPDYVFDLPHYAAREDLSVVVIYRDGRDVTASYLERLRAGWNRLPIFGDFDTPAKIARRWVHAIERMQRCKGDVLAVRYETLVRRPAHVAEKLGHWLAVDPAGFATDLAHAVSIASYRTRLSSEERAVVEDIAGPVLARLGYA